MRGSVVGCVLVLSTGCFSSTSSSEASATGGTCLVKISAAQGANNALQGLTAAGVSGDYSRARTTIVCTTLSQALELSLTGASPKVGVTYAVSPDDSDAGAAATAIVKYGESSTSGGMSTHVTWRGTSGTVKIDAVAKNTLSFSFSGVTAEVDPNSSQNHATGTLTFAAAGTVKDLLGFAP